MRRAARTIATALLVVGLVVATPATAAIADELRAAGPVATVDPPDFTPSPNKWQRWMVNVLSSVLGAATPSGFKAEQIANTQRYNWGWETLNAQYGYNFANPNYAVSPDSYQDYLLKKAEANSKINAYGNGPMRTPATKLAMFAKGATGVGSVLLAYEVGAMVGAAGVNTVGGFFGFDAQGAVCSPQGFNNDFQRWVFRTMAGQDCDFWDIAEDYIRNFDATSHYSANKCFEGAGCHSITKLLLAQGTPSMVGIYCGKFPTLPANWSYTHTSGSNSPVGSGGSFGLCPASSDYLTPFRLTAPYNPGTWTLKNAQGATVGTFSNADITKTTDDPERKMACKVTYTDNSTLLKLSTPFTEGQGVIAETECPNTPVGKTPKSIRITEDMQGPTPQAPGTGTEVWNQPTTPEWQEWHDTYPECTTGACKLDLKRKLPAPAVSCFGLDAGCPDWFTDPEKTDKYECTYGIHTVALEECNLYSGIFQPGRETTGTPYSDPSTGQWSGGQNAPKGGEQAMNTPIQNPENPRSCNFPEFALDPVSWVLTPVNCAMERNFAPRPSVVEVAIAGSAESWEGKPPQVIGEMVETFGMAPSASGCSITTNLLGHTVTPVNVCSGPLAALPILTKIITSGFLGIAVFTLIRKQIAGMVGYNVGQG